MAKVVVVASSELAPAVVAEHVDREDELVVVVPAVEQSRLQWLANDEDESRARARQVGRSIASEAPTSDAAIEETPDVPSRGVLDAIARHDPDLVIVALRVGEDATWLEEGELGQLPDEIAGIPIVRVRV